MKLNPDCIRDLLFSIEETSTSCSTITSTGLSKMDRLKAYSTEEILYHLQQLHWGGYIIAPNKCRYIDGTFFLQDLSPAGHEFISNIRKDTNWNKVKKISKDVGSETLNSLKTIAENVISSAITASMGLH